MGEVGTTEKHRIVSLKGLLLVYFLAFLLFLGILWYCNLITGLELQFTLKCNSLMEVRP